MQRTPALIFLGVGALLLVVVVLALTSGGDDGSPQPGTSTTDLQNVPTADLPSTTPETIVLNGLVSSTTGPTSTPSGDGQTDKGTVYEIQPGDTFSQIAANNGITLDQLIAANPGVDPTGLHPGDKIIIPTPTPTATPEGETATPEGETATSEPSQTETVSATISETPTASESEYVIKSGDTFSQIAADHGITLEQLLAANPGIDPNGLHPGDTITIPSP